MVTQYPSSVRLLLCVPRAVCSNCNLTMLTRRAAHVDCMTETGGFKMGFVSSGILCLVISPLKKILERFRFKKTKRKTWERDTLWEHHSPSPQSKTRWPRKWNPATPTFTTQGAWSLYLPTTTQKCIVLKLRWEEQIGAAYLWGSKQYLWRQMLRSHRNQ